MTDWNLFRHRNEKRLHIFSEKDISDWTALCGETVPTGKVLPDWAKSFEQKGICKKCQARHKESKEIVEKAKTIA